MHGIIQFMFYNICLCIGPIQSITNIIGGYEYKWFMELCVSECEETYFQELNLCLINFVFKFVSLIIIHGY